MNLLSKIVLIVQVLSALSMIGLILIQHGKGADMGAAFGSGSSGSLFGASGGANFLSRSTAVLAAIFFVCTLVLAYLGGAKREAPSAGSVLENVQIQAPAKPATTDSLIPGNSTEKVPAPGKDAEKAAPAKEATPADQIPKK
jgi:preprotein translocase subunit SecG